MLRIMPIDDQQQGVPAVFWLVDLKKKESQMVDLLKKSISDEYFWCYVSWPLYRWSRTRSARSVVIGWFWI